MPSSTPADLLNASPGRPNLFLPVAPGPRRTLQTPTGEGREQLPHPPAPTMLLPRVAQSPTTTTGTQVAWAPSQQSREGLGNWCSSPRPSAKATGSGRRGGAPHPTRGPLYPMAPGEPAAGQGTQGSSRRASCNLTPAASAQPAPPLGTARQDPQMPGHTGTPGPRGILTPPGL